MQRRRRSTVAIVAVAALPSVFALPSSAQQPCTEDVMLVFDASKSMAAAAGDNTGLRRIDAVRAALSTVLPKVSDKRRIGLVTYGPGSRPACVNVALDLRPRVNAGPEVMRRVEALKPDGRTPLTRAVKRAADALNYSRQAATIVLITDGEETCGGAPCALARELKAQGARTTVHVISYQIASAIGSDGVFASKCLADETGGIYAATDTVEQVTKALEEALGCPQVSGATPPALINLGAARD